MKFQINVKQYNRSKLFSAGMIGILCGTVCKKRRGISVFFRVWQQDSAQSLQPFLVAGSRQDFSRRNSGNCVDATEFE